MRRVVGLGPTTSALYLGAARRAAERTGRQQHVQLTGRAAEWTEWQQHQLPTAGGPHSASQSWDATEEKTTGQQRGPSEGTRRSCEFGR